MKGIGWNRAGFLALLGISLAACAANVARGGPTGDFTPYPPPGFAHEVSSAAVELFWNCARPQPDTLVLDGLAFNPWSAAEIRALEFALVGVDARGATVAEIAGEPQSRLLGTMRSTPFRLELRTTGGEARFDLFYRYWYTEPGEGDGHEPQHSKLQGGGPPVQLVSSGPILLAQAANRYLMVYDACSDMQHRAR